jgi:hypothetical protein
MNDMRWGICYMCDRPMNEDHLGYCDECIAEIRGEPMPVRVGCAECTGDECDECGGLGTVERIPNPPRK